MNILDELHKEQERSEYFKKKADEWQEKYYEIDKRLKETEKLLKQFFNSNTPTSQLPPQFKTSIEERPEKGSIPRGKPPGSPGATRQEPEKIDREIKLVLPNNCGRCGKRLIKNKNYRLVCDVVMKMITTEFEYEDGYCSNCGEYHVNRHPELPERGIFGYNLQSLITEVRHNFAGSYDKTNRLLESLFGVCFTAPSLNDCVERVAEQLEPSYENMKDKLQKTEFNYSDETSWFVNGILMYLWLFVNSMFTFVTIQKHRNRRVLIDIFGEKYGGTIISDCFSAYNEFAKNFQKDWIHLLRKAHFEMEKSQNDDIKRLFDELMNLYYAMKEFLENEPSIEERKKKYNIFNKKLDALRRYQWKSKPAQDIIENWIERYDGHWLTAILIPGIRLDNNAAERGIRPLIPTRKLLGGHRTLQGAKNFAIIETHRQTWKMHGKSTYNALVEHLVNRRKEILI
jgi:transposase